MGMTTPSMQKVTNFLSSALLFAASFLAKTNLVLRSSAEYFLFWDLGNHRYPFFFKCLLIAAVLKVMRFSLARSHCKEVDVQMYLRRCDSKRLINHVLTSGVIFQAFRPHRLKW